MEDGIDNNRTTLYDRMELEKKFLYVFIPENNDWKNWKILHNREKALELIKKNPGSSVNIFLQDFNDIYNFIYKV